MDAMRQYIKMCKQAWEIQESHPVLQECDYQYYLGDEETPCGVFLWSHTPNWHPARGQFIWLPRQDQLQAMIPEDINHPHLLVLRFKEAICGGPCSYPGLNSMEQLWLAFVMKEKYGKVWNGEDWVKAV